MKAVLTWMVCWAPHAGTIEFCPALASLISPVKNIIFLTEHFAIFLVPIA
jgi:hypothetical protein